ncbi:uncharacterized protein LOC116194744 [Punica granatum]|uniref:Phosphatidylinositol-specific phospholipase C X domain-containing protein n=2 Tax=Punica granatum TaxID=22663 RepID=A0A218X571_PUNGR|nr:uncharacterized protein LOC116194744 [Punica granatum]OWM80385.1 hypothetical protein CDL15_Pgr019665 [Punica granatum]PKI52895.1 hypothetical protein CRG98_026726 [Punica granatum]
MGSLVSKQIQRRIDILREEKALFDLNESCGDEFPGCDYLPSDRKNWMAGLNPKRVPINKIVWPGTHDSATNEIGIPCVSRPFVQCQSWSIYDQLVRGTRVLDIRVQEDHRVCHGILLSYSVDLVIDDIRRFLSETEYEVIILEVRTEFGHKDPKDFDKYLVDQLGEYLVHQDEDVFQKTIAELLPRRVILVWKPRNSAHPEAGGPLWSEGYLRDDWVDTDLPLTKFESNMKYLSEQKLISLRNYFYRVEDTLTPQADSLVMCVRPVTDQIRGFGRLFISQCFLRGFANRFQIFSTDFVDEDFIDACIGLTYARIKGKASKC